MESPQNKDRFQVFTHPRTASNLMLRLLNLDEQPSVFPAPNGGYFFLEAQMMSFFNGTRTKLLKNWTEPERATTREAFQKSFDTMEKHFNDAKAQNKTVIIKEHCVLIAEPAALQKYMFGQDTVNEPGWSVELPDTYKKGSGPPCTGKNHTLLPDAYLRTVRPLFLIRHPALAFASDMRTTIDIPMRGAVLEGYTGLRAADVPESATMTYKWSRDLYDWYVEQMGMDSAGATNGDHKTNGASNPGNDQVAWPIIIDADDLMKDNKVLHRLCEIMGLDTAACKSEWPAMTEEGMAGQTYVWRRMLDTLQASSKIVPGKSAEGLDIDEHATKWREEFGEEKGRGLENAVREAMPDYEFLRARRLRA